MPVLSAYTIAALLMMNELIVPTDHAWLINVFYLAWTLPLAGAMGLSLFAPERYEALGRRFDGLAGRSILRPWSPRPS